MTPREELLAAVAHCEKLAQEYGTSSMARYWTVTGDWLQLEADQHWHTRESDSEKLSNKWDLILKPEWVSMQPCIQMARLINGAEAP